MFDPPRHDSAETIRRALNLGVNVKMITGMFRALPCTSTSLVKMLFMYGMAPISSLNLCLLVPLLGDQLAIGKETGRRLGMGTNMYPSSALLGQEKDESIAALPVDDLIEKADGFAGVFPGTFRIVSLGNQKKPVFVLGYCLTMIFCWFRAQIRDRKTLASYETYLWNDW